MIPNSDPGGIVNLGTELKHRFNEARPIPLLRSFSRAGFYRSLQEQMPVDEDIEGRSAIQTIARIPS